MVIFANIKTAALIITNAGNTNTANTAINAIITITVTIGVNINMIPIAFKIDQNIALFANLNVLNS